MVVRVFCANAGIVTYYNIHLMGKMKLQSSLASWYVLILRIGPWFSVNAILNR